MVLVKVNSNISLILSVVGISIYLVNSSNMVLSVLALFEFMALVGIISSLLLCKMGVYSSLVTFFFVAFLVCGGSVGLGMLVGMVRWGGKLNLSGV